MSYKLKSNRGNEYELVSFGIEKICGFFGQSKT
ncbi:unknown [[Mannheimia] succiniciproducens MBEL55E]|uniref:Uncharacterized protein n=1 Tax=Mannheimia succiniciproducens (strain KCTC 0769BP / MBEL55E) TaxID=221988 RepID=Q65UF4_MANSM|nr:unknown [[Mannheimia] succiniciproducens MBEL55E]